MENEIDYCQIEKQYNSLLEKSIYCKLKRWEQKLLTQLRIIIKNNKEYLKEHTQKMNEQKKELEEAIKKEKDNYVKRIKEIQNEKIESLKVIEKNTKEAIKENNEKYQQLLSKLEEIKDDKEKIMEFFNNLNNHI